MTEKNQNKLLLQETALLLFSSNVKIQHFSKKGLQNGAEIFAKSSKGLIVPSIC